MNTQFEIYRAQNSEIEISVQFENESVWLNRHQLSILFDRDIKTIGKHLNNVFNEGELEKNATVANFATVQTEGNRVVERIIEFYNLDVIISVGYRVNSKRGTQFRQWATQRLKDYLVKGYSINENRLKQKQQEVEYLKTGIHILTRAIESNTENAVDETLKLFSKALELLDDYDHEQLDFKGKTIKEAEYPTEEEYLKVIADMKSEFESKVFAKPKDNSFSSSINQIRASFDSVDLYPSIEEKAAVLLYLIVKNHSFADGNKRIGASCFLFFLNRNQMLNNSQGKPIISNEALAAITLYTANSRTEEMHTVIRLIVSILNRNK